MKECGLNPKQIGLIVNRAPEGKLNDGTKEEIDNNKIINAVIKSATRMLVELTDVELKEICDFVDNNVVKMNKTEVTIAEMHNLVEGALEHINPNVVHSYRNYRNYKQDLSGISKNYVHW